jgi:hypothetical protein
MKRSDLIKEISKNWRYRPLNSMDYIEDVVDEVIGIAEELGMLPPNPKALVEIKNGNITVEDISSSWEPEDE